MSATTETRIEARQVDLPEAGVELTSRAEVISAERAPAEDESHYPTGLRLVLITLSMALVLILGGLDASIVSVAVPSLTDHFHTLADVGWYSSAYRLCCCSFQFFFGKLYELFPAKTIVLSSVIIFMLGSAICAAAPTSAAFVIGRGICGLANAGVIAGCFCLLIHIMPLRRRPLYASFLGSIELMANIAAPVLGGVVLERLGWRWCFWISLPIGAATLVGIVSFLPSDTNHQHRARASLSLRQTLAYLDLVGNAIFVPALSCLFIALGWAGSQHPWDSPIIIGLFCAPSALLAVFAWHQRRRGDAATLPPRILRCRSVQAGFVFSLCCNSALSVVEYYLPTYFQVIRGQTTSQSGYLMLPSLLSSTAAVLMQGTGVSLVGYYVPFMLAGSALMPVFAGLLTTVTSDTQLARVLAYAGLFGFACGIGFQAPQSAVQAGLGPADAPMGLAVILFAQSFGPAVFVSAAQSIFTNRLAENLDVSALGLNVTSVEGVGLSDLKARVGPQRLETVLGGFDKSLTQTWYLAVALACVTMVGSLTMEWRSVKQKTA